MRKLLKYLTLAGRPSSIKEKDFLRFVIVAMLSLFAGLVHLALIPLFIHIGATEMALVNVASVVASIYGLLLCAKGKHTSAILLITTEVWVHSVLAVMYLGLDVGFQHHLWATSALAILNTRLNFFYAALHSFLFVLTFALLYICFGGVQYDYKYSEYVGAVHFVNIMIAGIPFILSITMIRLITATKEVHMSKLASLDSLTGLYNRRMATEIATKILKQASRTGETVSVVLGDIDYFKKINDTFGHAEGDHVLSEVALFFRSKLRDADIIARWGGEEFLIVLFGIDGESACKKIDAVRQSFEQEIKLSSDDSYVVRMSFGVVEYQSGFTLGECLKRADDALYMSKHRGRNQVTLASGLDTG